MGDGELLRPDLAGAAVDLDLGNHGDAATPLWITEIAWGSAPPDRFGINKGLAGQASFLTRGYNRILDHRTAWNVQRLFWYHWRDPQSASGCSFCASAGLLNFNRSAKAAYGAFTSFTTDTTKPTATITGGPKNGTYIKDPTPTFSFASSDRGSTFVCAVAPAPFKDCGSPHTLAHLADGTHAFYVRAIDPPGNESPIAGRYFTVDTVRPAIPKITSTAPPSPGNSTTPKVIGTAEGGATVKGCTGIPAAKGTAGQFHSPGIAVSVPPNSTTTFRARATDRAGNTSGCSAGRTYVETP